MAEISEGFCVAACMFKTSVLEEVVKGSKKDLNVLKKFMKEVDSSTVYHNASTRFTDGFEFGMGAEIGISTDKLHARGPMGLKELNTYKYLVFGNGQVK